MRSKLNLDSPPLWLSWEHTVHFIVCQQVLLWKYGLRGWFCYLFCRNKFFSFSPKSVIVMHMEEKQTKTDRVHASDGAVNIGRRQKFYFPTGLFSCSLCYQICKLLTWYSSHLHLSQRCQSAFSHLSKFSSSPCLEMCDSPPRVQIALLPHF